MTNEKIERVLHHLASDQIAISAQMVALQHTVASLVRLVAEETDDPEKFISAMISKALPAELIYQGNGSSDQMSRTNYSALLKGLHEMFQFDPMPPVEDSDQ